MGEGGSSFGRRSGDGEGLDDKKEQVGFWDFLFCFFLNCNFPKIKICNFENDRCRSLIGSFDMSTSSKFHADGLMDTSVQEAPPPSRGVYLVTG